MRYFYCYSITMKSVCSLDHGFEFKHKMNEKSLRRVLTIVRAGVAKIL